jgi:uncharacterized protein (TIGR02145 family)
MNRSVFLTVLILILGLIVRCTKNDPENDGTILTIGTTSSGNFTPDKVIAYKSLEGYIVKLSSDTITLALLLPDRKPGNYSITNQNLSDGKAIFNIGFKQVAYSASEGTISITDTSNNSISGIYTVTTAANGNGETLKISNGKFDRVQIESFVYGTIEDYEHNQYKTLKIGSQTWMVQNLKSFVYSNGDSIREVYRYNGSESLMNIYGLYYTWPAATKNSNIEMTQGACPAGWHLPSNNEWQNLLDELGGETIAGGKLMSMQTWDIPNGWADNESGFSALAAGVHHPVSEYPDFSERIGKQACFWSSTFDKTTGNLSTAWSVGLNSGSNYVIRSPFYRTDIGFSIRCVKN